MRISLSNITKKFAHTSGDVLAVDNVNLDVDEGEVILLIGPSGSGKTTRRGCGVFCRHEKSRTRCCAAR